MRTSTSVSLISRIMSAIIPPLHILESSSLTLVFLPPEILHHILLYLDLPDLLSVSRVNHSLRHLAIDPHLHHRRLSTVPPYLAHYLPGRPAPHTLRPPQSSILLSRTHIVARAISRSLISIRLSRNLSSRPNPDFLVDRHILPADCVGYVGRVAPGLWVKREEIRKRKLRNILRGKLERRMSVESLVNANILPGELYGIDILRTKPQPSGKSIAMDHRPDNMSYGETSRLQHAFLNDTKDIERHRPNPYPHIAISPGLVEARRKVMKESLKDGLRAWIEKRALLIQRRAVETDGLEYEQIIPHRYTGANDQQRGDSGFHNDSRHEQPQRVSVKVLVKRFTNSIIQHQNRQSLFNNIHNHHHKYNPANPTDTKHIHGQIECSCDKHNTLRQRQNTPSVAGKGVESQLSNPTGRKWQRPPPPYSWGEDSYFTSSPSTEISYTQRRAWERPTISHQTEHVAVTATAGNVNGSGYNGRYRRDSTFTLGVSVGGCRGPTRGHVLGLRRFWEGVIRGGA